MLSEIEVNIKTQSGEILARPGVYFKPEPSLAVTMSCFGTFEVTHIKTGMKMSERYERFGSAALDLARWIAVVRKFNLDLDSEQPQPAIQSIWDQPCPFPGTKITNGAETKPLSIKDWINASRFIGVGGEFPWEDEHPLDQACDLLESLDNLKQAEPCR